MNLCCKLAQLELKHLLEWFPWWKSILDMKYTQQLIDNFDKIQLQKMPAQHKSTTLSSGQLLLWAALVFLSHWSALKPPVFLSWVSFQGKCCWMMLKCFVHLIWTSVRFHAECVQLWTEQRHVVIRTNYYLVSLLFTAKAFHFRKFMRFGQTQLGITLSNILWHWIEKTPMNTFLHDMRGEFDSEEPSP